MLKAGIPLGRFFGISIKLHYSWFIIFVLVTWALATGYFPDSYPKWSLAAYWGIGVATSLLFFLSVLAHELSHSLVAQSSRYPGQVHYPLRLRWSITDQQRARKRKHRISYGSGRTPEQFSAGRYILGHTHSSKRHQRALGRSNLLARLDQRSSRWI